MSTTAICVCGSDFLKVVGELARNSDRPIMFETVLALPGGYRATESASSFMNTSKCSNSLSLPFQLTADALPLVELPNVDYVLPRPCSHKLSKVSPSFATQCKMHSFPKYPYAWFVSAGLFQAKSRTGIYQLGSSSNACDRRCSKLREDFHSSLDRESTRFDRGTASGALGPFIVMYDRIAQFF
jgi:hypothetical protein